MDVVYKVQVLCCPCRFSFEGGLSHRKLHGVVQTEQIKKEEMWSGRYLDEHSEGRIECK